MIVKMIFVVKIVEFLKLEMEYANENATIKIVIMTKMIVMNFVQKAARKDE